MERTFTYKGEHYKFDALACHDGPSKIMLPDGTLLQINGWLEVLPPIPSGLNEVEYLPGMAPDSTPAY